MTRLPDPLKPWGPPLSILSPEVLSGLGRWLAPLRNLFGPLAPPRAAAQGELDGYDGLSQRGPYDRLLLSEWAVALELPDEFSRRAAMGEHMFTRPAFREPRGSSTSIALLDAGPEQLGAPRLAHLAALVVLEARAQAHGAEFRFRSLQHPGQLDPFNQTSLRWWAGNPTWAPPDSFVDSWQEQLAEHSDAEIWLVGGPSLHPLAAEFGTSLLVVEPEPSRLRITAQPRRRSPTTAVLPLPDPDVGVRILRAPLRNTVKPSPRIPVTESAGSIAANGRRLFIRDSEGFTGYAIPNSPGAPSGRVKKIGQGPVETLLGVDDRKHVVGLGRSRSGALVLLGSGLAGKRSIGEELELPFEVPHALQTATAARFMLRTTSRDRFEAWILDPADQLWRLEVQVDTYGRLRKPSSLSCLDRSCGYLVRVAPQHIAWHSRSRDTVLATTSQHQLDVADPESTVIALADNSDPTCPLFGAWLDGERFTVIPPPPASPLKLGAPDGKVFGLSAIFKRSRRPRLLFTRNEREVWSHDGKFDDHQHFSTSGPILEIRHEPSFEFIVWRTALEVGVYSLQDGGMRLRLRVGPEGENR